VKTKPRYWCIIVHLVVLIHINLNSTGHIDFSVIVISKTVGHIPSKFKLNMTDWIHINLNSKWALPSPLPFQIILMSKRSGFFKRKQED